VIEKIKSDFKECHWPRKKRNKIRKNVTQYLDISTTIREEKKSEGKKWLVHNQITMCRVF
jgi:hypothetical protein